MAVLVFLIFADMLIAPGSFVLGNQTTDMFLQFFSWRQFGFGQLAHGNLALWNPHIYGGAPYFGGTQGAMLYPTNVLLLFLPLPLAMNWSIALNVWLLGVFMYAWAGYRGLKPLACFVGGVLLMFCGPHFMHVYSGHPVHMASMTWAPLIFLALDGVFLSGARTLRSLLNWCLLGMFAVAMQILAGHPQYLFYTGISASIYVLLAAIVAFKAGSNASKKQVPETQNQRLFAAFGIPAIGMVAIFGGGSALAAVQLFAAVQSTGETIRAVKVPFEFAAMFGFPPENLLTLLNPYFFGDMMTQPYWGRCYLWEMSLFIGVTGLVLALYGAVYGRGGESVPKAKTSQGRSSKKKPAQSAPVPVPSVESAGGMIPPTWILIVLVIATFILAIGVHTPLFEILYNWCPGFSKFRGISKFTFQTALFLVMLSAIGFDRILSNPKLEPRFLLGIAIGGGCLLLFSAYLFLLTPGQFQGWLHAIQSTRESYMPATLFEDLKFADNARVFASKALLIPGLILLAMAGLLHLGANRRQALYLLVLLIVVETFAFALHARDTFDSRKVLVPGVKEAIEKTPGDYRILNVLSPNSALSIGAQDLWGFDPGVVGRYAEFIAWTQHVAPDKATQYVNFSQLDPLYTMLRLKYAFVPDQNGLRVIEAPVPPMDRLELISECKILRKRDDIFNAMRATDFNPRKEVILETAPSILPGASEAKGKVRVVASSTDWLEVEADVASPTILLNTDIYTPAWRAVAMQGSVQQQYTLQPANYTLRAVPLSPGHHHLRIEYAPAAFTIGKWVSILSWLLFFAAMVGAFFLPGRKSA